MRWGLGRDATLLIVGQGVRAAGYGFIAVILGALLATRGYSPLRAGIVLTAIIAGTALASLVVGRVADTVGRRRCYAAFFLAVAAAGAVLAAGAPFWLLLTVAVTGTLSTDVVDNGPATTLEQVMLAREDAGTARAYGRYNAVGAASGALGALAAALPGLGIGRASASVHPWLFLALVPVGLTGALCALQLSPAVEASPADPHAEHPAGSGRGNGGATGGGRLGESRAVVRRLAGLFALDAAGAVQQVAFGAPLLIAGVVKGAYDLALWRWARHLPLKPLR